MAVPGADEQGEDVPQRLSRAWRRVRISFNMAAGTGDGVRWDWL